MEIQDRKEIVENVSYLIKVNDTPKIKNLFVDTHPADLADIIRDLEESERDIIFDLLDPQTASEVMLELDEVSREQLIEDLEPERLSEIVDEMDSDDATDVVSELPKEIAEKVLSNIDARDRYEVEQLLTHDEETAGGIMALEFVAVYDDETVDDAIQEIRQKTQEVENVYNVYAIDRGGRLAGVVPLKKLILSNPKSRIQDIMNSDVVSVITDMDQEDVANIVRKYDLVSVPVVDTYNRLVGRITVDDIVDVLHEEATEDIQRMAGIADEEILQEMSTFRISRYRLPWLVVSFVGELGSALLMRMYQATLEQVVATAFFIPLIMAMGGNVGIQASTIVVRSLALQEGGATDKWSRLIREIRVALLNGLILAMVIFVVIYIFFSENPQFGIVIGLALMVVMLNASIIGAVVPIVLNKFGIDPAIATGPFITTFNDILGVFIYLSMTMIYIKWL